MFGQAEHPRALMALSVSTAVVIVAVAVFESSPGALAGPATDSARVQGDFSAHLETIHTIYLSAIERGSTEPPHDPFSSLA